MDQRPRASYDRSTPWLDDRSHTASHARLLSYFGKFGIFLADVPGVHRWAWTGTEMSLARILLGVPATGRFFSQLFPPDRDVTMTVMDAAMEALRIAIIGTAVGAISAIPLGFLAKENLAPRRIFHLARTALGTIRTIPLLVYALVTPVGVLVIDALSAYLRSRGLLERNSSGPAGTSFSATRLAPTWPLLHDR
jgi:hypothetical protein